MRAFIVGGVLGVLAASLLESWLLSDGVLVYLAVGLIEEFAKLIALVVVARRLQHYAVRDGVVLGAAVGFGFAALESSGYALTQLFVQEGSGIALSLSSLVLTEILRGVLAPVGHGLWTAMLGGVLFAGIRGGRLRITRGVVGMYVLVSLLHAWWDSMRGIATVITAILTAARAQEVGLTASVLTPPAESQVEAFFQVELGGLAVISLAGLVALWRVWRTGRQQQEEVPA